MFERLLEGWNKNRKSSSFYWSLALKGVVNVISNEPLIHGKMEMPHLQCCPIRIKYELFICENVQTWIQLIQNVETLTVVSLNKVTCTFLLLENHRDIKRIKSDVIFNILSKLTAPLWIGHFPL